MIKYNKKHDTTKLMIKTLLAYTNSYIWTANDHTGQTARYLNTGYKEHVRSIRYNKEHSAFAIHILYNRYLYGRMGDIQWTKLNTPQIMNISIN
jgi:hypothetical protein